jgi:hypothetical protein
MASRCQQRAYALRRKSEARTKSRNCFGVSGGGAGGGALAGFDFTTVDAALRGCLPGLACRERKVLGRQVLTPKKMKAKDLGILMNGSVPFGSPRNESAKRTHLRAMTWPR